VVSNVAKNDRADSTTANGGDEERSTTLGVATETTESKGEDDGEDARLEEEYDHQHAKTSPVGTSGASSVGSLEKSAYVHMKFVVLWYQA
jgi:hypothetical protein